MSLFIKFTLKAILFIKSPNIINKNETRIKTINEKIDKRLMLKLF